MDDLVPHRVRRPCAGRGCAAKAKTTGYRSGIYVDVNGVSLYDEKTGESFPLIFSHEFSIDYPSWEPQVAPFGAGGSGRLFPRNRGGGSGRPGPPSWNPVRRSRSWKASYDHPMRWNGIEYTRGSIMSRRGRAGLVVPTGLATDDSLKHALWCQASRWPDATGAVHRPADAPGSCQDANWYHIVRV